VEEVGDHVGSQKLEFWWGFKSALRRRHTACLSWSIRSLCCNPAYGVMYPPRYRSASSAAEEGIISPPSKYRWVSVMCQESGVVATLKPVN
jgi:hypothetical protein